MNMKIPFFKLHGAKNDFLLTYLLTDLKDAPQSKLAEIAVAICDRYTGVGADGWMLVDPTADAESDASIRLFNSDGSEPELSGNGTRCAGALLSRGNSGKTDFRIRTGAGIKHLHLLGAPGGTSHEYRFEMNMGEARIVDLHAVVQGHDAVLVDVGNPQCVIPVSDFDFDWAALGAATEWDARFPKRTNVSFVRKMVGNTIEVRFWERGAGLTHSSGTGSTGATAAALARGLVNDPVNVSTPAGMLVVRREGNILFLTGPAEFTAEGIYHSFIAV